jgi:Rps23 Pro-64 3,4-dihydroxylase Tpa1-like proline 4-hydroxylase
MKNTYALPDTTTNVAFHGTLPMEINNGMALDPVSAFKFGETLSTHYRAATPYPHVVIDNFLPKAFAEKILENFPIETEKNSSEYALNYSGIQKNKRQVKPQDCNDFCRNAFGFFNSAPFLQFVEGLTGINGLISDPYFNGGGFHEISSGGKLGIHADFRIHEELHLVRRINVLIYLNSNWEEHYGGCLEIWDKSMCEKQRSIAPLFNRCVVFNTDATSYHGHPEPLTCPEGVTRKSIALYYYTASKAVYDETPSNSTMYVDRPNEDAYSRKQALILRLQNYAKDFLPPILFRTLRTVKQRIKGAQ